MTSFTSDSKLIPHNRQLVYDILSNMDKLAKIKERFPEDKVKEVIFDRDSCSISVPTFGQLRIVVAGREAPETVQWTVEQAPVETNLRVRLTPASENETQVQLTVEANLNPFLKSMVSRPLQEGINKIAGVLTVIPYDELQE